ncbi:MAG: 6-hydroxymethylpterin diphosphokinase MptE-like protein, partial [Aquificaceae bacterium]
MGFINRVQKELMFRKNLSLFEEKLPPVAQAVQRVKTPIKIREKEGKLDALVGDVSVYDGDVWALVQRQLEFFEKVQPKLFESVGIGEIPKREDIIAFKYGNKLLHLVGGDNTYKTPPLKEGGFIPLLIVIGVGFGMHIKELMERYHVQNLILIDTPLYFRLSLYWLDWEWVFDQFSDGKRQLHIILMDNKYSQEHPDEAYEPILRAIQGMNPANAWFSYYIQHLAYDPPLKPIEWLREHPMLKHLLYGYFDDELWSLDWTIEKVARGIPLYYGDRKVPKDVAAFVLGAGPSLDKSLETIERYKDKAILVSCGSTITSLQKVGIKPHIHVELERTKYTYDVLVEVDPSFLRDIFLVTTNTVWTQCFDLFKEGGFVIKYADAGEKLLRILGIRAPELANISPTVTAMGVSLCASLGFEEVYLFGVDLGSKEPKRHHSKHSNYYNPKSMLNKVEVGFDKV